MVRLAVKSTLKTEEKILATVESMQPGLKNSVQEKVLRHLGVKDPYSCNEAESWVKTLRGVTLELKEEGRRWNRRDLRALGTLSNYCDLWLSTAQA